MKKIKFSFENDILYVGYKDEENVIKNINNTNIITDEDLIFDIKYFKNNNKLIAGFLNVMIKNDKVTNCIINDEDLIIPTLDLLNYIPNIKNLVIAPDITINYEILLAILRNDTLKTINCYTIPTYLLERLDTTKKVKIETRNEVFFISNFLRVNKLNNYSDMFYKRRLIIDSELTDSDWQDFESFLTINTHLKSLYFETVSIDIIKKFLKRIKDYNKSDITFNIKGNEENLKYFKDIASLVKKDKYIRKNNIKFSIDYTKEYKLENLIKLINFTTVKYILIVIIASSLIGYAINEYDIYQSSKEVKNISENITDLLEEYEEVYEQEDTTQEQTEQEETSTPPEKKKSTYISPYYKNYAKVISVLKETNDDTVAWLTVNNTTVNYPVVQSINNSYYLTHDFNKKSNTLGWIFMDYRNNPEELDQNTIIYGHNIAKDKIMFGDLGRVQNSSWYLKEKNQYITFNTKNKDMQWKIFSIYKIENTNDYLYNKFETQEEFLSFVEKMKNRSIYNFGVDVKENDKLLTLSTCQNSGKNRLVVHAVLIE